MMEEQMLKNSNLPWERIHSEVDGIETFVVDSENNLIADTYAATPQDVGIPERDQCEYNAELICRAVNAYGDLVSALQNLVDREIIKEDNDHYEECMEALKKAKGR